MKKKNHFIQIPKNHITNYYNITLMQFMLVLSIKRMYIHKSTKQQQQNAFIALYNNKKKTYYRIGTDSKKGSTNKCENRVE